MTTYTNTDFQESYLLVKNDREGIQSIITSAIELEPNIEDILFCMENTGYYGMPLTVELSNINAHYWLVPGLEIKLSKGISRGKTDKTDSKHIALYAISHLHKLRRSSLPQSLEAMTCISCSTIMTVLPASTKKFNWVINFSTSVGCSPLVGSSSYRSGHFLLIRNDFKKRVIMNDICK